MFKLFKYIREKFWVLQIMGRQLARDLHIKDIQVYVDSLLITNHYNGSYGVKGEKLVLYLEVLKQIAATFDFFEFFSNTGKLQTRVVDDVWSNYPKYLKAMNTGEW